MSHVSNAKRDRAIRGCVGKTAWLSREEAERGRRQTVAGSELHSYQCPRCGLWHLGH